MNPTTHIKTLIGILLIALAVVAMACGSAVIDDSTSPDGSTEAPASLGIIEESHDAEAVALDANGDGDAHDAEPVALDTHDDGDAHDAEPVALDTHDDGDEGEVVEGKAPWGFDPEAIEVTLGHRVKLTRNNDGTAEHDVEMTDLRAEDIGSTDSLANHDRLGGAGHDEVVVAAHAMPGTTASVMFTPTVAGEYEFYCTLPGHRDLGMVGKIIVTEGEA